MSRNLMNIQANADQLTMLQLIDKWSKASSNPEVKLMMECLIRNSIYINALEMQLSTVDTLISNSNSDKLRAILRARDSEAKIDDLQKIIESKDKSLKAFGL